MSGPIPDPNVVVGRIYEAAAEPARWPAALAAVAAHCGVDSSILYLENHRQRSAPFMHLHNVSPETVAPYTSYYVFREPGYSFRLNKPAGTVTASNQLVPDAEFRRSEYYNDFLRGHGLFYTAGVTLVKEAGLIGALGIQRPKRQGGFQPRDLAPLHQLYPHLRRALRLMRAFGQREAAREAFAEVLEHLPHAVFLLDDRGCAVYSNGRAEALLRARDGLRLEDGLLVADHGRAQAGLVQALVQAVRLGRDSRAAWMPPPAATSLPRPSGRPPYAVLASPLRHRAGQSELQLERLAAAVFVYDPATTHALLPEAIAELFGLTPAEARVAAALAQGQPPQAIAVALGASPHTVRTHLRAIREKLGVRRQAEVVQRVLSSPAAQAEPAPGPPAGGAPAVAGSIAAD